MTTLNHSKTAKDEIYIIHINGPLNSETAIDFEENILNLVNNKIINIIIDAHHLSYISSEGIGTIIYLAKKLASIDGELLVASPTTELSSIFELLHFDRTIRTAVTIDQAIELLTKKIQSMPASPIINSEITAINRIKRDSGEQSGNPDIMANRQTSEEPAIDEVNLPDPLVVECTKCKNFIRINKSGYFLCPTCQNEFSVNPDSSIVW